MQLFDTSTMLGLNAQWLIPVLIWTAIIKGYSLWRAGRNRQAAWFIVIFIINLVGILGLIYLAFFQKEGAWLKKKKKARKDLLDYYNQVNVDYEDKIKMTIANLPSGHKEREKLLIEELTKVNDVFPKIDKAFATKLYASLKENAKHIAEASGGVFGYMSVGYEESRLIDLKMIKDPSK